MRKRRGYIDRAATEQLACRLKRESAQVVEGLRASDEARRPIGSYLQDYLRWLRAKANTVKYVDATGTDLSRVFGECGFVHPTDMSATVFVDWLAKRKLERKTSARTWNRLVTAVSGFARWLVKRQAMPSNPFDQVPRQNERADRRRVRRTVSPVEIERLIEAARGGDDVFGLAGPDRVILYLVALSTGFRANELGSLTPSSFDLGERPIVSVAGSVDKARRGDGIPIHPAIVPILKDYVKDLPAARPVWPGRWTRKAAEMLRVDMAAARIPVLDATGRVFDFHSLRSQYISSLALAGVGPVVLRELARHSTIDLTLRVYTQLGLDARAEGIGRLTMPGQCVAKADIEVSDFPARRAC